MSHFRCPYSFEHKTCTEKLNRTLSLPSDYHLLSPLKLHRGLLHALCFFVLYFKIIPDLLKSTDSTGNWGPAQ